MPTGAIAEFKELLEPDGVSAEWKLGYCSWSSEDNQTPTELGERRNARDGVLASGSFAVQNGFFWVLAFVHHFSPVAVVFIFFLTWFLFFSEIFSFLQFSVLNLTLRQLHVVFPVEKPASSSLCLVSVCRQVWKASCSTAVGQAERVLGRKCWFYRHWCTDQHSRGVVTLWAHRVQTLLPAVLVSSLGISSSAPHVASWWINGAWWGKTGLFTWLEVCDHGQGHSVSRCYFRAFTVIGSIW